MKRGPEGKERRRRTRQALLFWFILEEKGRENRGFFFVLFFSFPEEVNRGEQANNTPIECELGFNNGPLNDTQKGAYKRINCGECQLLIFFSRENKKLREG